MNYSTKLFTQTIILLVFLMVGTSCSQQSKEESEDFHVAVVRFSHESPGGDPGIEDWTYRGEPETGDDVLSMSSYVRGFTAQSEAFGDMELVGLSTPRGVFGGTSRSWNQEETFNHFVNLMIEDLEESMPVDGVYLSLHGAMAVRNIDRPEAEIAKRFRDVVGPDVPIVGTFDLHGNEDEQFLEYADGAFVTKRFPHYDAYRQGQRASRYLRNMMRDTYTPTSATRKPPILTATILQWTGQSPIMDVMERARRWEDREQGAYENVFLVQVEYRNS